MPERPWQSITDGPLDLLIAGGGILGAGLARDAAMRHLRTALVEQNDFASGTSSRTSRLLHGGLRYLAQGRIGLVLEASREKLILQKIAPHLARPMAFTFPAYRDEAYALWKLKLGVRLYDRLCNGHNFIPSEAFDAEETLERYPHWNRDGLVGSVEYADAQTLDSRLVLDTLFSASNREAKVFNYAKLIKAEKKGKNWICAIKDRMSGDVIEVEARCVINATGPWAGTIPNSEIQIRPTKGVHLVFSREALPIKNALVLPAGKRILFALPWGDRTVLGTTDTDYAGDLSNPELNPEDIEYLLQNAGRHLQGIELTPDQILSSWAGIRPLVVDGTGKESEMSRKHMIRSAKNGWWDVAGGKLTTYRLIAEQTINQLIEYMDRPKLKCTTAETNLLSGEDFITYSRVVPGKVDLDLVARYCKREWAQHLDDVMLRRTAWGHYWPYDEDQVQSVAKCMGEVLGWSREKELEEFKAYQALRPDRLA